ncbi:sugar phosphate isomerase/epimerase [Compostibacter hankyongensis]|uniref:Sugar phosphate isomerase/epimerase n=1 Tax=Compostibacter hankyongensis TaxID=1007089 RepID=A0ABP8FIE7_9BACT
MTSRRSFLKQGTLLSLGIGLGPSLLSACSGSSSNKIGLQLYTVRDAMQKDPSGTLARVAEVGYQIVEGATYTGTESFYGMSAEDFAALLKKNGLQMPSSHYMLGAALQNGTFAKGTILHDWEKAVEDAHTAGLEYMVCAYLMPEERKTIDDYKQIALSFNKAGETCKKAGIQFCYHNHNFEFESINGELPYNVLLRETDKDLVKMEMDLYWVTRAGRKPLELFQQNPGRFPLWHVKDMDNTPEQNFTEVGSGVIDFKTIFQHKQEAGMQHFFVEQDKCPGDPFVSITKSYQYLKKNIV